MHVKAATALRVSYLCRQMEDADVACGVYAGSKYHMVDFCMRSEPPSRTMCMPV